MVGNSGSKKGEPRKYFSTLYYANQESRNSLPTAEEQAELAKLKTNYEGTRYQVPADMHDVQDARQLFKEIDEDYDTNAPNKADIRWNREHSLENKNSDYDYRFWLQYLVEEISAGNRSMELTETRTKEFHDALSELSSLTLKVAENLYSMSSEVVKKTSNKEHPLEKLIELNRMMVNDSNTTFGLGQIFCVKQKSFGQFIHENFSFEKDRGGKSLEYLKEKPLFYHLANTTLQVYFKSIRKSTKVRSFENKADLIKALNELGYVDTEGESKKKLRKKLKHQLLLTNDEALIRKNHQINYVCELNSFFRKLYNKLGKVLSKWAGYYTIIPNDDQKDPFFEMLNDVLDNSENRYLDPETLQEKFRTMCIKTAGSCLISAQLAEYINLDSASVEELESLYDSEYEGSNASYPNVVRMSKKLLNDLNQGQHAIIRHFQMDRKRNMYCLPKSHLRQSFEDRQEFGISGKGNGGFLHNESMTVSLHPALTNLIEKGSLIHTRFEPSEDTINALNILQKTQWSINLDFLDFIAYFTYEGAKITPYPEDIRQVAWQRSDNMMLRDIFVQRMGLQSRDSAMESRFRDIKFILKQARKNLLNAGNVFWHPWFCDWRGRFNTRVNELSPQGNDLSKAMLLFAEWKPLGKRGRYWLYVRAYELLRKIPRINKDHPKLDAFDMQVEWVERKKKDIIELGKEMNCDPTNEDESQWLDDLKVGKPKPKSEIFQRIAFLIEFVRIHEVYDKEKDWDKVKSGLPIHLDASCNGFQHIAALTRNEKLAKDVNVLNQNYDEFSKGDLYQAVADTADRLLKEAREDRGDKDFPEAKKLNKHIDNLELNKKSRNALEGKIFSREFCKPLVILAGYGARDLSSTIMNYNGKKLRGGRFKRNKDSTSKPTLHLESALYQVIHELNEKHGGGFGKLVLKKEDDDSELLTPADNCELAHRFGLDLANYLRECIIRATDNKLGKVKKDLTKIYSNIDTLGIKTGTDLEQLENKTFKELGELLRSNNKTFKKLNKAERLNSIKKLVIKKWKNKLYFSWQANETSSIVRYIKWKLSDEREMFRLPVAILSKDYKDPGPEEIQNFIINSPDLSHELKIRLIEAQESVNKYRIEKNLDSTPANQSAVARKLTSAVFMCLRNIILRTNDDKHREVAKNHYYARFTELDENRIKEGIRRGHLYSINTSNKMKFSTSKAGLKKLSVLSGEIIRGMLPNYIHSFDALHMQNVVLELDKKGKHDIWAVHDSFGVHACDIDDLRDIVRETFVEIHRDPIQVHLKRIVELNRSILEPKFVDKYIVEINKEIEEINRSPSYFKIKDVLHSNYLIS